jgi:hypothetical protein
VLQLLQQTIAFASSSTQCSSSSRDCEGHRTSSTPSNVECLKQLLQLRLIGKPAGTSAQQLYQEPPSPSISAGLVAHTYPRVVTSDVFGIQFEGSPPPTPGAKPQPQPQLPPAVQQLLQPEEAASLVTLALRSSNEELLQVLCEQLQALQLLPSDAVRGLLQEAVDLGAWGALRVMRSSLPGAVQVVKAGLVTGCRTRWLPAEQCA